MARGGSKGSETSCYQSSLGRSYLFGEDSASFGCFAQCEIDLPATPTEGSKVQMAQDISNSQPSTSGSFEDGDEEFIRALASTTYLTPTGQNNDGTDKKKSPLCSDSDSDYDAEVETFKLPDLSGIRKRVGSNIGNITNTPKDVDNDHGESTSSGEKQTYMETDAYKPTAFGDFGTYMKNKRLKLKIQEEAITEDEARASVGMPSRRSEVQTTYPPVLKGACIYINGHTNPPYAELRRLIHLHGGELMPYLDQKTPLTHIIASNLTAKKRIEFERYRVVRPEWVTASVEQGRRLNWRDYRCDSNASGAMKAGALGQRADIERVKDVAESKEEVLRKKLAKEQDWRSLGEGSTSVNDASMQASGLLTFNESGSGSGTSSMKGIGPWGKESRQKTLGVWARQENVHHFAPKVTTLEETECGERVECSKGETLSDTFGVKRRKSVDSKEDIIKGFGTSRAALGDDPKVFVSDTNQGQTSSNSQQIAVEKGKDDDRFHDNTNSRMTWAADISCQKEEAPSKDDSHLSAPPKLFPGLGTDPPTFAAAVAAGHTLPSHPYTQRLSNTVAAQLLSSPSWRQRNTASGEGFLAGFFEKSRLHHLSSWKIEMKEMVAQAMREAGREQGSVSLGPDVCRVIMHIDFDAFFVAVGLRKRPELAKHAVVVCHNTSDEGTAGTGQSSTSEIASCNYEARKFGIRNGMSLGQARRMCADVQTIAYDFTGYNDVAVKFYALMLEHADAIEAVSIDEALIDVSLLLDDMRKGAEGSEARRALLQAYRHHTNSQGDVWTEEKQLAEALRDEIRARTGCEASIGIGANVLQARLATRRAKPGASFHLRPEDVMEFTGSLDVDDLHGVGWSMRNRFMDLFGTYTVGEARTKSTKSRLKAELGDKMGATVWDKLHGRDRDTIEAVKQRQSCGANVNYAIRFQTQGEAKDFVQKLSEEVSRRLKAIGLAGRQCVVSVMIRAPSAPVEAPKFLGHGLCDTHNRSTPIQGPGGCAVDDGEVIFKAAWPLIKSLHAPPDQLRGIGVTLQRLVDAKGGKTVVKRKTEQTSLRFPSKALKESRPVDKMSDETEKDAYDDDDNEGEDERDERILRAGPCGGEKDRQRSVTPEVDHTRETLAVKAVPQATQFSLPPASQLDPDAVAALPLQIRQQIGAVQQASISKKQRVDHVQEPRVEIPKSSSTNTTPTKPFKAIDPFAKMKRASSTTPTKKEKRDGDGLAIEKRKLNHMPRFSQIDPSVLQELPESMRMDIMREIDGENRATEMESSFSSESPRKSKQQRLSHWAPVEARGVAHRSFGTDGPSKAMITAAAVHQSTGDHNLLKASRKDGLRDPTKVSASELQELGIDFDFFRALPSELQLELVLQQRQAKESKKARFKGGRAIEEKSLKDERRLAMATASSHHGGEDDENGYHDEREGRRPHFLLHAKEKSEIPLLKGKATLEEIRLLLAAWVNKFASTGPREADTAKFESHLVQLSGPQHCDPDKVASVLQSWKAILNDDEANTASEFWWEAFDRVTTRVQAHFKQTLGGRLKV